MLYFRDGGIFCWGEQSQGGAYILRMQVNVPLQVQFGRFLQGQPIEVPIGVYLYVGSAMAQKGATSLARRLLRHASRSDSQNPHPIRRQILAVFPKIGLGPTPLYPPTGKKLRWHVDFLLDEVAMDLTAVYIIRAEKRNKEEGREKKPAQSVARFNNRYLETAVAHYLLTLSEITPLVPGLGSTDDPGGTHLLKVTAVPDWWQNFPEELTNFLREIEL
ncbi:GIY-YIG nuclease family protein [Candidatus Leptofilum sp.]|uniref:GIY-YIG nuclease family protein n=1 Tax=Candidatus Leptofilum sp. TaxID=3241576 RepID=UPI003B590AB0